MKRKIYFLMGLIVFSLQMNAQQFINKAIIEYEVKTSIKKTMGNNSWEELMKENMPDFKTGYYTFTFADNKSIYKFDRWEENMKLPDWLKKEEEDNVWYFDHTGEFFNMNKNVFGNNLVIQDSIPKIQWKVTNESRNIAGFNCRKAIGKIMDSVYVFAFYTDEITISGGPCSINGLPGMILGLTIPRMYSSWIATKVSVNGISEKNIHSTASKKMYSSKELDALLKDRTKNWTDEESKKWKEQIFWRTFL